MTRENNAIGSQPAIQLEALMKGINQPIKVGVAVGPTLPRLALGPKMLAIEDGHVAIRTGRDHLDPATRSEGVMRSKFTRAVLGAMVAIAAFMSVGLLSVSSASAATSPCSDPDSLTNMPTGPTTVSTADTSQFGKVLVIGSGAYQGCSIYLLTSDQLHKVNGSPYACSDGPNVKNKPCDTVLWPAVLTDGAPVAGRGVDPRLLGTVTRTDLGLSGVSSVQQVTYNGWPLYRFFRDTNPGDTVGANQNDPVTSPQGIWYLLDPRGGIPATGPAELEMETAPVDGTGPDETVLAAKMDNDYTPFPDTAFPLYTLTPPHQHHFWSGRYWGGRYRGGHFRSRWMGSANACPEACTTFWPPVLTQGWPEAGPGVDQRAIGVVMRPDGSWQVTYHGRPLYLFNGDAYVGGSSPVGTQGIYGAGDTDQFGLWNTIPPVS
jgi:predicted lipoprotein with Yx(FWY)xxD motif